MEEEEDGSFDDDDIDSEGGGCREAVLSLVRSHHTLRYAMMVVADRKSQVWQCLGFCSATTIQGDNDGMQKLLT